MSQFATAQIIPFPSRPRVKDDASGQMAAALFEQQDALREWQAALNELSGSLCDLGGSLRSLEQALAQSVSR